MEYRAVFPVSYSFKYLIKIRNNDICILESSNFVYHFSSSKASNEYSGTLDKIVDVTIAYPEGKPLGLFDILSAWRDPCAIHVHYKIYDIKQVKKGIRSHLFMHKFYKKQDIS